MPKTVIEKSQSPSQDVTVFSVSGTLGFHEKDTLVKLFDECKKRGLARVVFDMAGLTSLGGGCARIIRAEAESGNVTVGIAGAKATVLKFLADEGGIVVGESVDEAVQIILEGGAAPAAKPVEAAKPAKTPIFEPAGGQPNQTVELDREELKNEINSLSPADGTPARPATPKAGDDVLEVESSEPLQQARKPAEAVPLEPVPKNANSRELQKRIVQYNTLFSLNSDFYRIQDRTSLVELFLLTTIAQVGVESAIFLEHRQGYFTAAAVKGLEADELKGFALSAELLNLDDWIKSQEIYSVETAPFSDEIKAPLLSLGCSYLAPFIAHNHFRAIVALGKPIKSELDDGTKSFLKILINQTALAYESTQRFEEEKERTLGLVQTLIALIEENTLARGNTNLLSCYTYALAQKLHYPKEYVRDLLYGTVLRDIGMIKVSDLIVRSPRELMPEEWNIIKRHPIDGGAMLKKMKFSEHAVGVVVSHHERFNGEGYPNGLQGKQIPLGARVVSIVESYAAMLQERPTRPALTQEEALNTLKENWGMRYDPDLVKEFVEIVEEELRTGERVQDTRVELFSV
jgi:HD-GYP domain-containing protein (c-di-GMP phosphodiesterase class II)